MNIEQQIQAKSNHLADLEEAFQDLSLQYLNGDESEDSCNAISAEIERTIAEIDRLEAAAVAYERQSQEQQDQDAQAQRLARDEAIRCAIEKVRTNVEKYRKQVTALGKTTQALETNLAELRSYVPTASHRVAFEEYWALPLQLLWHHLLTPEVKRSLNIDALTDKARSFDPATKFDTDRFYRNVING